MTRLHGWVVALCFAALTSSGCTSSPDRDTVPIKVQESGQTKGQESEQPEDLRAVVPLDQPIDVKEVPPALRGTASSAKVEQAAKNASGSMSAERFALTVSQAVMDVRKPVDMPMLLGRVGCDSLPSSDRDALIAEVEQQAAAGFGRRWDTTATMWIRSQVDGASRSVELAGVVKIADGSYTGWNKYRVDVEQAANSWCVSGVSAEPFLPSDPSVPRERANIRDALEGPGWRAVRP